MSQASVTSTRTAPLLMGHVCSHCKVIILQEISITVKYTERYSFSRRKAEDAASAGSLQALKNAVARINACRQLYMPLQDGFDAISGASNPFGTSVVFKGVSAPCPCCGIQEPWQASLQNMESAKEKMKGLDNSNFPIALDPEMAPKWVQLIVSQCNEQSNFARRDVGRIKMAEQSAKGIQAELDALSLELRTLPAYERKASLTTEADALAAKLKASRFSDFKGKREIHERLRTVKNELMETETMIQSETARVKAQMASKRTEYRQMAAVAYGYTGKVTETRQDNAIYYELVINSPQ